MKKLLVALLSCVAALAVQFAWDDPVNPPAVTGYRLYELSGTNRTLLASTTNRTVNVDLPVGQHRIVARAVHTPTGVESVDSNAVDFWQPAPVAITITITGTLQFKPQ